MEWSLHLITGLIVMPILLGAYWLLWPYRPVYETAPPVLLTPQVRAGDQMLFQRQFCVQTDVPPSGSRQFVSTARVKTGLPQLTQHSPPGCHDRIFQVTVPEGLPAGKYWYEVTLSYEVNPLRTIHVVMQPVQVDIVP